MRIKNGFNIMLFVFIMILIKNLSYLKKGIKREGNQAFFSSLLFLASDAKMPKNESAEKIMNPVFIEVSNPWWVDGLMVCFPI